MTPSRGRKYLTNL